MTRRSYLCTFAVITVAISLALLLPAPTARAQEDVAIVKVTGQGIDKDAAVKDALRNAVEKGGLTEIAGKSQVKDYALEFDVVLARSSGLVKDYKVLNERTSEGLVTVEIEAKVSKKLIDATWAEVTLLLKQLGRPKIMVFFTEVIHDLERPEGTREVVQTDSVLGTQIERKLLKLGFKLVNAAQMKEIDRKKAEIAAAESDAGTLKSIASGYGAAIYIRGTSRASGPQKTTAAGIDLNMWETDATVQGFWTETGDAIFSNSMTGVRGGSRVAGPPGGRQALEKTGQKLADASVFDMLEAWSRGTSGGVGDIIVEVKDVATVEQAIKIKKALEAIKGVEEVSKDGARGTVKFTVVTNLNAENFVESVVELKFEDFKLEVEDQKMKTITCKVK